MTKLRRPLADALQASCYRAEKSTLRRRICLNLFGFERYGNCLVACLNLVDHLHMTRRKLDTPLSPKTYGYCRVSTVMQANEGFSLDDQKSRIAGYCQANGLPAPAVFFVDAATSGTVNLQKREQGNRMLENVRRGDHIIVTRGDRLFRSAKNALEVAETLREKGVELHLMDMGGPCLQSSVSRLVFGILMMVANMESERIGERTASVKEHLRKQGRFVGGLLPVGYTKTPDGRLVRDRTWKRHAAQIKKLSEGGLSVRKIAAEMKSNGLQLSYSTVYAILTDKRKVDAVQQA